MKTYIYWGLIVVSLSLNVFLSDRYRELRKVNFSLANKYEEQVVKYQRISSVLKENGAMQRAAEAMSCPDIVLMDPKTQRNCKISDLLEKNNPLLFFRFKETDCDACIQQSIELLKRISKQYSHLHIVVLSGYENVRQFYAYANSENKLFEVYNVNELPILPDSCNNPYFFILNRDLLLRDVFFYIKEDRELNIDYLKCIIEKYW